jgi:VWFA-related protein
MAARLPFARASVPLCLCLALLASAQQPEAQEDGEPREIGLVETTGRQLAQLDVTVTGPESSIAGLTAGDFELVVGGRFIEEFIVDDICRQVEVREESGAVEEGVEEAAAVVTAPATYLFYFDHHHLKAAGRQNALDIARSMIPELVVGGNRASIVSAGEKLVTFADMTSDVDLLLDAIDRIEGDIRQWDQYPYQEELRIREVLDALSHDGTNRALMVARRYQKEDRWRTEKALRLFSLVIGRLADLDPPKAAIYFADNMRSNAGEFYMNFFGRAHRETDLVKDTLFGAMEMDSFSAANPFDRLVEEAAAHGVRLYTIQAEGLTTPSSLLYGTARAPAIPTKHISDAQDSLVSLAKETGGRSFLNGVRASKIAHTVQTDLECIYLLSFDPSGFPVDKPLPALVRVNRPKVKTHARGTFMIQGESSRLTSRLLSAFVTPGAASKDVHIRGVIIPTGFAKGRYSSLVQVAVPGSAVAQSEWEIGLSLVSRGKVREDASGRIEVGQPGVPLVFETEMSFSPGPFELITVAHSINTDQIATMQIDGDWPNPNDERATVGPIAVMQPASAAFLREGELRARGALGKDDVEPVRIDLPTAIIGLVCRSKGKNPILRIERTLKGEDSADFSPMELEFGEERCAQIRDLIPPGIMTAGEFTYELHILDLERNELATASRAFIATEAPASGKGS